MFLPRFSVKHPISIIVFAVLPFVIGFYSLRLMPIDLFPEIDFPLIVIQTKYEGVAPAEIETLISKPIEEAVASVEDLDEMKSISEEGQSLVIVQFNFGTDMNFASLHLREKLDIVKDLLPDEADSPILIRWDPASFPVMQLNVSGPDLDRVKRYCEDIIKPKLESIKDVSSVNIQGGLEREIRVELDWEKLRAFSLSANEVIAAIHQENLNKPANKVDEGRMSYLIRTVAEFKTVPEVENVILAVRDGTPIRIKDVATVKDDFAEVFSRARMALSPSVSMQIFKVSGGNTVKAADAAKKELKDLEKSLPPDIKVGISMDFSPMIKQSIQTVKDNAYSGAWLAGLVLLLFLRNWRSTLIIMISVPTSIVSTFFCMYLADMTLNLISLGGLALGVGMVVDNSIVVIENIYRHIRKFPELSVWDNTVNATSELGLALTASTFTTVAVFFPIVFVEGIAGEIFKDLALVVVFSIMVSLIVALTVVPAIASRLVGNDQIWDRRLFRVINFPVNIIFHLTGMIGEAMNTVYEWILGTVAKNHFTRIMTVVIMGVSSALVIGIMKPDQSQFPKMDEGQVSIEVEMPQGSNLDYTDQLTRKVEEICMQVPEAKRVSSTMRGSKGNVFVDLGNKEERTRTLWQVMEDLRARCAVVTEAVVRVQQADNHGSGDKPVQVEIVGNNYEQIQNFAKQVKERMKTVTAIWDIQTSFEKGKPEIQILIDRKRAADLGLSARQIAETIETYMAGTVAGQFRVGNNEYDICVRLMNSQREFVGDLEKIQIANARGELIPLSDVTQLYPTTGPISLQRDQQMRMVSVVAQADRDQLETANAKVREAIKDMTPPQGCFIRFGGEFKAMMEAFQQLGLALIFAIFLVFLILAAQFESFSQPLIIMTTVPLSVVGVFLGLFVSRVSLSIPAYVGIIMLTGIVVNNAILLVDYINVLRSRGYSLRDAAVESSKVRLRPVLMTTLTTVLGMMPMAFGWGSGTEFYRPLALAVMGGLTSSTIFTLILTPVLYIMYVQFAELVGRIFRRFYFGDGS